MRRVYTPPSTSANWPLVVLGAMLLTLGIFLVLPLTQMISSGLKKDLEITKIDTATPPPPPETFEMEEPPPPEPEEPEPRPELTEQVQQLSLSDLDLDLGAGGSGGFLKGALANFEGATEGLDDMSLFDVADLDKAPSRVSTPSPRYPAELKKQRITGHVVLVFIVNLEGRVEDARVESSSRVEFEEPALAAIRRWRYKPGERQGRPVRAPMRQRLEFKFGS